MDLTVGRIVWARRHTNDIYWPGRITIISNNTNDLWSSELNSNYFVQFFVTNQSAWITDILPYRQYRDSMTNDSFINYGLHSTIKQEFLNAINQADYENSNEIYANNNHLTTMTTQQQQQQTLVPTIEDNTDNDFLLTPDPIFTSNTEYYNSSYQSTSNINKTSQISTTNSNDWYTKQGLIVESITPPLPSQNDISSENISLSENFHKTNSVIIITTKTYSNSSFIFYLFNCFSHFIHHSIIYIDDLINNFQHPTTLNISYLICLDYFDFNIQQILNSTILNNFIVHTNYFFLILNSPSYELIKYFYSAIIDQRTILILNYHLTFDNEPLLLCSGNRTTYELIRSTLLKYLCTKIKYIESENIKDEQLYSAYCISSMIQSTNILNNFINEQIQETLNEKFDQDFLRNNTNVLNELFPQLSISKNSNENNLNKFIHQTNEDVLQNQSKQLTIINDLFENQAIKTHIPPPISEYYLQNILHEK